MSLDIKDLKAYEQMQASPVASEAHILSKRYRVRFEDAFMVVSQVGYAKAEVITQELKSMKSWRPSRYIDQVRRALLREHESGLPVAISAQEEEPTVGENYLANETVRDVVEKFGVVPDRNAVLSSSRKRQNSSKTIPLSFGHLYNDKDWRDPNTLDRKNVTTAKSHEYEHLMTDKD